MPRLAACSAIEINFHKNTMTTTLITVSGMTPAIITETIWALACETPPIVPDEVVVITTLKGESDIRNLLLTKQPGWKTTVWKALRKDVFENAKLPGSHPGLQLSIRIIEFSDPDSGVKIQAQDVRDAKQNAETADFILNTLSPYANAENSRVIASIAGGRKAMGALLYAAVSLVGEEGDRITHVLVSEPFEACRGFFYKEQPVQNLTSGFGENTVPVSARDAVVELADIPFVPLRNKFRELNEPTRTFAGLVNAYSKEGKEDTGPPILLIDVEREILVVEGRELKLIGRNLILCDFLYQRCLKNLPHFANKAEAHGALNFFMQSWRKKHSTHRALARLSGNPSVDDIPKALSNLRKKLTDKGLKDAIPYLAPLYKRIGFDAKII